LYDSTVPSDNCICPNATVAAGDCSDYLANTTTTSAPAALFVTFGFFWGSLVIKYIVFVTVAGRYTLCLS
jgi:hypothetical protein